MNSNKDGRRQSIQENTPAQRSSALRFDDDILSRSGVVSSSLSYVTPPEQREKDAVQRQRRSPDTTPPSFPDTTTSDEDCIIRKWSIRSQGLAPFPPDNVRGSMTIECRPSISDQEVLDRISNFLRVHSIESNYDEETARIDGRLDCSLLFSISLWASSSPQPEAHDDENESRSSGVIVELQRRQGCAIGMQRIRKGLFHAIMMEGNVNSVPEQPLFSMDMNVAMEQAEIPSTVSRKFHEQWPRKNDGTGRAYRRKTSDQCLRDCLSRCYELLESNHQDENQMGLENLLCLSKKMDEIDSYETTSVARALILKEGRHGSFLRQNIARYLDKAPFPIAFWCGT